MEQGRVSFVTNYDSRKGRELAQNARAALVFHWDHSHRQIRMEGVVVKAPAAESDEYFASRNWQRRIGAWASAQSQPLRSREQLNARGPRRGRALRRAGPHARQHQRAAGGGHPAARLSGAATTCGRTAVELWIEGASRIHERARWTRSLTTDGLGRQRRRSAPAPGRRRACSPDAAGRVAQDPHRVLLVILAVAAWTNWYDRLSTTDWDETLTVGIFPIDDAERRRDTRRIVAGLSTRATWPRWKRFLNEEAAELRHRHRATGERSAVPAT